jgi:FkbM family methyltransferase
VSLRTSLRSRGVRTTIELRAKSAARRVGADLQRYPRHRHEWRLARLLDHIGATTVIDVGAHYGEFASELRTFGFEGRIVSIEPMAEAFERLADRVAGDPQWDAHRLAIGAHDGELRMRSAESTASSTAMMPSSRLTSIAPQAGQVGDDEVVEMVTLVSLTERLAITMDASVFVKVDTQGFERAVLDGAGVALQAVGGVQLEAALVELYEGEALFDEQHERLRGFGFRLAAISPVLFDELTGESLQVDAVYLRDGDAARED